MFAVIASPPSDSPWVVATFANKTDVSAFLGTIPDEIRGYYSVLGIEDAYPTYIIMTATSDDTPRTMYLVGGKSLKQIVLTVLSKQMYGTTLVYKVNEDYESSNIEANNMDDDFNHLVVDEAFFASPEVRKWLDLR